MEIFGIEVKVREIAISAAIVLVLGAIGFLIDGAVEESVVKGAEVYNRAFKPTDENQFLHGARTSIGNTLMFGTLAAVDPVQTEHADGSFLALQVNKERYTMHTRVVTTTDANGNTSSHTEFYWTWDVVGREKSAAESYSFCGLSGATAMLNVKLHYVDTDRKGLSDIRYVVYGVPEEFDATLFLNLQDGAMLPVGSSKKVETYSETSVDDVLASKNSRTGVIVFRVLWIIFIIAAVVIFIIAENRWLDGGKIINFKWPSKKGSA
ncbi:MAG: hypothetical protein LBK50_02640 [Candidatus Nomurabacteria bacterium]|jgi:hypothetical protein|nr:hypothetical protein [Candidatus Nomurabacteria bacterium]